MVSALRREVELSCAHVTPDIMDKGVRIETLVCLTHAKTEGSVSRKAEAALTVAELVADHMVIMEDQVVMELTALM
jgi:hypothetical protein